MNNLILKGTDLSVSPFSLGCVGFGSSLSDEDAYRELSFFSFCGGNFIDTARIYGAWANRGDALSERIIGKWLKESGKRHNTIISTKGAHMDWESLKVSRVYGHCVEEDLDNSLKMLGTDYIDLYFLHRDRPGTPVEELLVPLENAVKKGKIRYYGCSNWSLKRIREANAFAKENGFSGFTVNQLMWGLPDVKLSSLDLPNAVPMDKATYDYMLESGMSAMGYSAMAGNYFGKRLSGKDPGPYGSRIYSTRANENIIALFKKYTDDPEVTPLRVLLSYYGMQKLSSVPIISFSTGEHIKEAVYAVEHPLNAELIKEFTALKAFTEE